MRVRHHLETAWTGRTRTRPTGTGATWSSWPLMVALVTIGLIAVTMPGQTRGGAYGRYVAVQALVERRATVLDGFVEGSALGRAPRWRTSPTSAGTIS